MSFASSIKAELSKVKFAGDCCRTAQCYGMLLFGRSFRMGGISLTTESAAAAHSAAQLTAQLTGAIVETKMTLRRAEHTAFVVSVDDVEDRHRVFGLFGHTGSEVHLRVNRMLLQGECCLASFLRGAFLSCGTAVTPQKEYRLEFAVPHLYLARDLCALLEELPGLELLPAFSRRQGSYVVYLKGGDRIEDLLTLLSAPKAAMEIMQARMLKEVRNNVNRKTNFETANIGKTAAAAALQITAIEKFLDTGGWQGIPEELRELARLRYDNPDLSLKELGEGLLPVLSRSGVNHRLQKLIELAEDLPAK